jgi:hypothetical protein
MGNEVLKVKAEDRVLVDDVRESPVDRELFHFRRTLSWILLILIALLVLWLCWRFGSDRPVVYSGRVEHFKYGSIGSEPGGSLLNSMGGLLPPEKVFKVLPDICPDKLPGGYAALGFTFEAGRDLPIGISRRFRLGFEQLGVNCALCHTGTWRETPASPRHAVAGMPANRLELQRLFRFILDCTLDERFTADNVIGRIRASGQHLSDFEALLYRATLITRVQETTLMMKGRMDVLLNDVPEWGPGRVDTFNPYKSLQFHWLLADLPHAELIGSSDYPSLWNQEPRARARPETPEGMHLHWDGNNNSVDERNLSASLGAGVTPVTVDHASLARIKSWIWTLKPPAYPFPVDANLATRGQALYQQHCAACHADHRFRDGVIAEGSRVGTVVPIAEIGTDPYRLHSYTAQFAANQYTLYPDSAYRFTHFRKTDGYANQPLDGLWLRAPYLHNGSVPTLRDLLEPPEKRPRTFFRGYDVFDPQRVGFISTVASEPGKAFFRYDTSVPGNGNGGHLYGVNLADADKDAIVEYLKKF